MNSWFWQEYLIWRGRLILYSLLMCFDAAACDCLYCQSADVRDTPSVSSNMWSHHTDLWEIESLITTSPEPDSRYKLAFLRRNLISRLSPENSFSERTLFDFVPCNVNAILIDENRRPRPRLMRLCWGVRAMSALLCVSCMFTNKQTNRIGNISHFLISNLNSKCFDRQKIRRTGLIIHYANTH